MPLLDSLTDLPNWLAGSTTTLGVLAFLTIGACVARARSWREQFVLLDLILLISAMTTGTATGIQLMEQGRAYAKHATALESLTTLRTQIQIYKLQHGDTPPLLYQGLLPQLTNATNAAGRPGQSGVQFPLGPYLSAIPANPLTGVATITATDQAPPQKASGTGGWLYHQATGRIFADVQELLDR